MTRNCIYLVTVGCIFVCTFPHRIVSQRNWDSYDRNHDVRDKAYPGNYRPPGGTDVRGESFYENEDYGDKRCRDSVGSIVNKYGFKRDVTVQTHTSSIVGRRMFLCDGPGVTERYRPRPRSDKEYRPYDRQPVQFVYSNLTVFRGIPYAKPPTQENNLRFKPPEPPDTQALIDAFDYKDSCPQNVEYYGNTHGFSKVSEDCLYLNVFSPSVEQSIYKYPVMVYIHGGFFDHGSANVFPAHMLAASQQVVVVTFNYRLGPFGYLSTADSESPGNYGLMDQALALQWVEANIWAFNGDNKRITLFGPDAGAASAALLAFSPKTSDLVKRVIAQSGSAAADWALITDPAYVVNTSRIFAENLGCSSSPSWRLVKCLRERGAGEMVTRTIKPLVGWLPWGPVIDLPYASEFLKYVPRTPEDLLKDMTFRIRTDFAYMTGLTKDEGSLLLKEDKDLAMKRYIIDKQTFETKVSHYMNIYNYTLNAKAIFDAITFMYTPWEDPENTTLLRQGYIDLLTDSYFTGPNDKMVKLLLERNIPTYMYVLNYSMEGLPEYVRPKWMGIPHDEEYFMLTGAPFMDPELYPPKYNLDKAQWTEADRNMSQFFMEAWANFAKDGKPTPQQLFNVIYWEPMMKKNLQYLPVNSTNTTSIMLLNYRQKQSQFWTAYLPSMINKEPPTWPPTVEEPWVQEKRLLYAGFWSIVGVAGLFVILTLICCILYCRAKSKHLVDDDQIPVPTSSVSSISSYGSKACTNTKYVPEKVILPKNRKKDTAV